VASPQCCACTPSPCAAPPALAFLAAAAPHRGPWGAGCRASWAACLSSRWVSAVPPRGMRARPQLRRGQMKAPPPALPGARGLARPSRPSHPPPRQRPPACQSRAVGGSGLGQPARRAHHAESAPHPHKPLRATAPLARSSAHAIPPPPCRPPRAAARSSPTAPQQRRARECRRARCPPEQQGTPLSLSPSQSLATARALPPRPA